MQGTVVHDGEPLGSWQTNRWVQLVAMCIASDPISNDLG